MNLGLKYTEKNEPIFGYSDADWGGDLVDQHSFTGYVFLLSGSAVSLKSQKQKTVSLSSSEAEYISVSEEGKKGLNLCHLLDTIGVQKLSHVTLFIENRGAQQLAENSAHHPRTKHVDIRHHFIREIINEGKVSLDHVPSQQNLADVLIKPLPRIPHWESIRSRGMIRWKC